MSEASPHTPPTAPPSVYVLVLLRDLPGAEADAIDHEPFIDSLIDRGAVLLGGTFDVEPAPGVGAAYLLRCADLGEAKALVAQDPLVRAGAVDPVLARWDLVGIDVRAADHDLVTRDGS